MDTQKIIASALQQAGVGDFSNDSFIAGLEVLATTVAGCKTATSAGRSSIERQMIGHLANRFAIEHYLQQHAQLKDSPVQAPIFVLGTPRTGTTLMVNLLDQLDGNRTLLKWEANNPVPPAAPGMLRKDPRCLAQNEERRKLVAEGKLSTHIHFEWADSPTECVFILMEDFKSTAWDAFLPMPEYSEFLLSCDMVPTYRWHKQVLQVLQENNKGRWTLKAPCHALFAPALLDVYPDARLIWMHRRPEVAVASLASLMVGVHKRYQEDADYHWIREFYPRQLAAHINRMMAIEALYPDKVFHVAYDAVVAEPLATVKVLHQQLGIPLQQSSLEKLASWVDGNPRGQHGEHRYTLTDFGISEGTIDKLFGDYKAKYAALL